MHILKKTDWSVISNDPDRASEMTRVWTLPHGTLCEIKTVAGIPVLENGAYSAANSTLAKLLIEAGVEGTVSIYTPAVIPQTISRWLTWWLSTEPTEDDIHMRGMTITLLGKEPTKRLPFQVNILKPIEIRVDEVYGQLRQVSRNPGTSLVLIEHNGEFYKLEPERHIDGRIVDCTEFGYVVKTNTNLPVLVPLVSRRVQGQIAHATLKPEDLIGARVSVEYTMFTEGKRLCNFKSPILHRCYDLDDLCEGEVEKYSGPYPFTVRKNIRQALLTTTRCGRAAVAFEDGDIVAKDPETHTELYRFSRDPAAGLYAARLTFDGKSEVWRFDSNFTIDTLDPQSFIRSVDNNIYYATGYSIDSVYLNYTDRTVSGVS
ncbi:MAG: hypothetical protein ACRDBQ_18370 [Shewanella sp.]